MLAHPWQACQPLQATSKRPRVQEKRGRWNSIEAIGQLGWSGTAFLGGWLIDRFSYSIAFHVTAVVQLLSLLVRLVQPRCVLCPSMASHTCGESSAVAVLVRRPTCRSCGKVWGIGGWT